MELIRRNTPEYFAAEEEIDLSDYLDREIELYYVLVTNDRIVGCGGINFADDKTVGKISWDIIHPDYQGKSLGKQLLEYRIDKLKSIAVVGINAGTCEFGDYSGAPVIEPVSVLQGIKNR